MENNTDNRRILALDILRGITICGMILVNNPGSWSYIYAPLEHARWNGLTPTDLVFPFFMFIMGISAYISLRKYQFALNGHTLHKILKRTAGIYLVGLFIGWFAHFCYYWNDDAGSQTGFISQLAAAAWSFPHIRLTGVLARLAICYGLASLIAVTVSHRRFPYIIVLLLAGYFAVLVTGNGFSYGTDNILSIVDKAVIGSNHLYNDNGIDPEGLLSTIPSLAHVLLGFHMGRLLFGPNAGKSLSSRMQTLLLAGGMLTFAGFLLSYGCPINKKIWSPTFVLATCGLGCTLLGLLIYTIDIRNCRRWTHFFEAFGINPLFVFVMSDIIAILLNSIRITVNGESTSLHGYVCNEWLFPSFGNYGGSLAYALVFLVICWLVAYPLYKRRIFIKL